MKFPNHIIIDVVKQKIAFSDKYWIFKYFDSFKKANFFLKDFSSHKKLLLKKEIFILNKLALDQLRFTIKYSTSTEALFLNKNQKKINFKLYEPRPKVKHKLIDSNYSGRKIYNFLKNEKNIYDLFLIKRIFKHLKNENFYTLFKSNLLWTLFNINFLRKEKIYTKLKYSRVPQYDIVSGGAAALLAGFLGFLITEKFGFELVDSGDFYFLFMYLVFLFFSLRLFLKITDSKKSNWNCISLKWLINFYKHISLTFIYFIKNFFNK